jgi:DNA-binding LytR/AlgR family response regulator
MTASTAPTALIADDEPLLRQGLRQLLARLWPELCIVAEVRNGREAVEAANRSAPQIAFLDVRMPVMGGVEAARLLCSDTRVVFVTAFEEHAIAAFDAGAVDYVVKPVEPQRLQRTVTRLQLALQRPPADLSALLRQLAPQLRPPAPTYLRWVRASVGSSIRLVAVDDVLFFHADDKYTRVVTAGAEVLIRKTIKELIDELDPTNFVQVHRSTIVNLRRVERLERTDADYLNLRFADCAEVVRVSRNYAPLFRQM